MTTIGAKTKKAARYLLKRRFFVTIILLTVSLGTPALALPVPPSALVEPLHARWQFTVFYILYVLIVLLGLWSSYRKNDKS
jgi:hypothetical protein